MNKYTYKKKQTETPKVEVTVPSGNVFLFYKPSKYSIMFNLKAMPVALTEQAMQSWKEKGIGDDEIKETIDNAPNEDRLKVIDLSFKVCDKILELCIAPKIVLGQAKEGEVSVSDISEPDLDYLFKWVASGGVASPELADFRERSEQDALASAVRPKVQPEAVANSGVS